MHILIVINSWDLILICVSINTSRLAMHTLLKTGIDCRDDG